MSIYDLYKDLQAIKQAAPASRITPPSGAKPSVPTKPTTPAAPAPPPAPAKPTQPYQHPNVNTVDLNQDWITPKTRELVQQARQSASAPAYQPRTVEQIAAERERLTAPTQAQLDAARAAREPLNYGAEFARAGGDPTKVEPIQDSLGAISWMPWAAGEGGGGGLLRDDQGQLRDWTRPFNYAFDKAIARPADRLLMSKPHNPVMEAGQRRGINYKRQQPINMVEQDQMRRLGKQIVDQRIVQPAQQAAQSVNRNVIQPAQQIVGDTAQQAAQSVNRNVIQPAQQGVRYVGDQARYVEDAVRHDYDRWLQQQQQNSMPPKESSQKSMSSIEKLISAAIYKKASSRLYHHTPVGDTRQMYADSKAAPLQAGLGGQSTPPKPVRPTPVPQGVQTPVASHHVLRHMGKKVYEDTQTGVAPINPQAGSIFQQAWDQGMSSNDPNMDFLNMSTPRGRAFNAVYYPLLRKADPNAYGQNNPKAYEYLNNLYNPYSQYMPNMRATPTTHTNSRTSLRPLFKSWGNAHKQNPFIPSPESLAMLAINPFMGLTRYAYQAATGLGRRMFNRNQSPQPTSSNQYTNNIGSGNGTLRKVYPNFGKNPFTSLPRESLHM